MFFVCNDNPRVGFGSSSSVSGKVSDDCGSGEVIVIGITSRGDECDRRRGGDACGGPTKTFLDGERPRKGLKPEIKSDHQYPKTPARAPVKGNLKGWEKERHTLDHHCRA